MSETLYIEADGPGSGEGFARAAALLGREGVIGYPTETVYGLGGNAYASEAWHRIAELKQRAGASPFIILIRDPGLLKEIAGKIPGYARRFIDQCWPGPLTLVFAASRRLPGHLTSGTGTIAVRISPDPVCRRLLEELPFPLISTSANPAGREPARTAGQVADYFPGGLDAIIDGGERKQGEVSSIVSVAAGQPVLIREGALKRAELETIGGRSLG
ncbi:threonylcarbamoyl-AMP synthase [bacterium]|nr:threonylcarbamoyl-AMP synthase [bacterium]